ncbi:MAG: dihydropteroate synthase [Candidatus Omnitrophica bacterium]|nr:dihydropteroate synthase [Candidatus Omnitrophota bacterium]
MRLKERILPLDGRTGIMGILNVTPDSFSDGGELPDTVSAVKRAERMLADGADLIDIGGESTRPGALPVKVSEELERVVPVIKAIKKELGAVISVDTYKSGVARAALDEGADLVNDISGLNADPSMAGVIAHSGAACILMHMKGTPRTMQKAPFYSDIIDEITGSLKGSVSKAEEAGIDPEKIIIDPGIGFGKTVEDNLILIRHLDRMSSVGKPIMIGTSRKSFIGAITGRSVKERIHGTVASVCAAVLNGASIVRVHDVGEVSDALKIIDAIKGV